MYSELLNFRGIKYFRAIFRLRAKIKCLFTPKQPTFWNETTLTTKYSIKSIYHGINMWYYDFSSHTTEYELFHKQQLKLQKKKKKNVNKLNEIMKICRTGRRYIINFICNLMFITFVYTIPYIFRTYMPVCMWLKYTKLRTTQSH